MQEFVLFVFVFRNEIGILGGKCAPLRTLGDLVPFELFRRLEVRPIEHYCSQAFRLIFNLFPSHFLKLNW